MLMLMLLMFVFSLIYVLVVMHSIRRLFLQRIANAERVKSLLKWRIEVANGNGNGNGNENANGNEN